MHKGQDQVNIVEVYSLIYNAILKKQSLNINTENTVICKYPILKDTFNSI